MTGNKLLPQRVHQCVPSNACSLNFLYPLFSLSSSRSYLRHLLRLSFTYVLPSIFPSVTCFRPQFPRTMWQIHLASLLFILCRIFLSSSTLCKTSVCISKYNQQDATLHNVFVSVKCSTCFRWVLRPSSGAQNCIYSIGYLSSFVCYLPLSWKSSNSSVICRYRPKSSTTAEGSRRSLLDEYPILFIQFWAPDDGRRTRLKHVEHFTEINTLCKVAPCWLYLKIY
jgi:hypothetical protein